MPDTYCFRTYSALLLVNSMRGNGHPFRHQPSPLPGEGTSITRVGDLRRNYRDSLTASPPPPARPDAPGSPGHRHQGSALA